MYQIIDKIKLGPNVEQMTIHAPYVARNCLPGQFIILRVDNLGERIPLTIVDFNRNEQTVTIIYQIVGYTTRLLSKLNLGDYLEDFVGPLGKPAMLKKVSKVLGIGGGVGIAPLYPQIKRLKELGCSIDVILGGKNSEHIILQNETSSLCDKVHLTTDDGSLGVKGYVTTILRDLLASNNYYNKVIAIGPLAMMKAVVDITKPVNIPTSVSLNPLMIDGTGMCGSCRVTINGEVKFACVDGPDFDGFAVDFDECLLRQKMYREEENHMCRIGLGSEKHV